MNEEKILAIIEGMDDVSREQLGELLVEMSKEVIKDTEKKLESPEERKAYQMGKDVAEMEQLIKEYEAL